MPTTGPFPSTPPPANLVTNPNQTNPANKHALAPSSKAVHSAHSSALQAVPQALCSLLVGTQQSGT